MPNDSPMLSYGQRSRWHRRRLARNFVVALLLGGLTFLAWENGPHAWRYARDRYWYERCMRFTASAHVAVYERLAADSAKPAVIEPYVNGDDPKVCALIDVSIPSVRAEVWPAQVTRFPRCLMKLGVELETNLRSCPGACAVFCHERTSPGGKRRLVYVTWSPRIDGPLFITQFDPEVAAPPSWGDQVVIAKVRTVTADVLDPPLPRKIFAGQPDPADTSHFTIGYQWDNGIRGFIDGWLLDDDSVELGLREGPGDLDSARESKRRDPTAWGNP